MKDEKYIWNTKDIFSSEKDFEETIEEIKKEADEITKFKGKLSTPKKIYECLRADENLEEKISKAYAYAMLKHHEDTSNAKNLRRYKLVSDLYSEIVVKESFMVPEILKLTTDELKDLINKEPKLKRYNITIEDLIENKEHILSEENEKIISTLSNSFGNCEAIFDTITDTDFKFPSVIDKEGNELELTHSTYIKYLESKDEEIRKQAFKNLYSVFGQYINTLTETYLRDVKIKTTLSKLRKYNSSLEKAVKGEDSTVEVYNSLIKTVNKHLDFNHRYLKFKKKQLGLKEMHMYDLFVDITEKEEEKIPYEEGKNIVKDALSIMGKDYCNNLSKAFDERWIHVYEQKAKRSGAYSMGVYGVHPYVLLNYTDNLESVSTLAHELGHAMHSYYSSNARNFTDSEYTIMVAEVASTVNETLLAEYLIKNEKDPIKKASLINTQINMIRSTLIRQTMFAEFEQIIHSEIEKGKQLAAEDLNDIYYKLNEKYMGKDLTVDEEIKYEWARIPHFYSSFYVYKYATGISSAIAIAKNILDGKEGYVEKYIEMLKMGGSVRSLEELKSVGVDLTTEKPVEEAFEYLEEKLRQLEDLTK